MNEKPPYHTISYKAIYKDVCQQSKLPSFYNGMLAGHFLTREIGRLCSTWFIKHSINPNKITLLMIVFGIVGSVLFAISNVWCKVAGYFCWLMWFAMDCSDGQVARYTKTFSKYGTEMDYMAHLIDHPFMNIALWLTFLDFNIIDPFWLSLMFIASISIELVSRNFTAFNYFEKVDQSLKSKEGNRSLVRYLITQSLLYPNLIIIFTPFIIMDFFIGTGWTIYLYFLWFSVAFISFIMGVIKRLSTYYKG